MAPTANNQSICQKSGSISPDLKGSTILWYSANVGGIGSSIVPSVDSNIPLVSTFFGSQTVNGCESARQTVTVEIKVKPTVTASNNVPLCFGDQLQLSALGAQTYSWTSANGFTSVEQNPSLIVNSNTQAGIYTVTGTSSNTCTNTASTTVANLKPLPVVSVVSVEVCEKQAINLVAIGTGGTVTWTLPDASTFVGNTLSIPSSKYSDKGTYTVFITQGSCSKTTSVSVIVKNCAPIAKDDFYSTKSSEVLKIGLKNHPIANDSDSNDVLLVSKFKLLSQPKYGTIKINTDFTITYTPTQKYEGTEVIDYEICDTGVPVLCAKAKIHIQLSITKHFLPNVFTPNEDGNTDTYVVYDKALDEKVKMWVYNRWGDLVFESDGDYQNDWKGTSNRGARSGSELPSGTYYLIAEFNSGEKETKYITIIK